MTVQPRTISDPSVRVDERATAMRQVIADMGLRVIAPAGEPYEALDQHGVAKYRWRTVEALIAQMTGDNMPRSEKRERLARGLYAIHKLDGSLSYEVGRTVNGQWRYGGRFSTLEEALDKLNEWGMTVRIPVAAPEAEKAPEEADEEARLIALWRSWQDADAAYREALDALDAANDRRIRLRQEIERFIFSTGDDHE